MARYSINGQILSDMADAIRANKGEVQPEIISGATYSSSADGTTTQFKVEKGKKYKITFTVTRVVSTNGDGFWPRIRYKSGSNYYNIAQLTSTAINLVEGQTETFIFESSVNQDTAYLAFGVVWYADKCDATFTLEEVDADGNSLYVYTPEEMVAEVEAFKDRVDPKFLTMVTGSDGGASITELPEGITTIRAHSFNGMKQLTLTSLPDSVTTINDYAFNGCSKLALTSLPEGLTTIGSYSFQNCSNLALTSLPDSVTKIGGSAFAGSPISLESLPKSLTFIGSYALDVKGTLPSTLIIPAGVTELEGRILSYSARKDVTEVIFLGTPTEIGASYSPTFGNQTQITSIKVPWSEGEVANAPWGATNATITYDYVHEEA